MDVVVLFLGWDGDDGYFIIYWFFNDKVGYGCVVEYCNVYNEFLCKVIGIF